MSQLFVSFVLASGLIQAEELVPEKIVYQYCADCHDANSDKGGVRLDRQFAEEPMVWERVHEVLKMKAMPPAEEPQLTAKQQEALLNWIEKGLQEEAEKRKGEPGPQPIRRLTKAEYLRILNAASGLNFATLERLIKLPNDPLAGEGFSNVAASLRLSAEWIESCVINAEQIAPLANYYVGRGLVFSELPIAAKAKELLEKSRIDAELFYDRLNRLVPKEKETRRLDYIKACYRHRTAPNAPDCQFDALAQAHKLDPLLLRNWWATLNKPRDPESEILMWYFNRRWNELPITAGVTATSALPQAIEAGLKRILAQLIAVSTSYRQQWEAGKISGNNGRLRRTFETGSSTNLYLVSTDLRQPPTSAKLLIKNLTYTTDGKDRLSIHAWLKETSKGTGTQAQSAQQMLKRIDERGELLLSIPEVLELPAPANAKSVNIEIFTRGEQSGDFAFQCFITAEKPDQLHYHAPHEMNWRHENPAVAQTDYGRKILRSLNHLNWIVQTNEVDRQNKFRHNLHSPWSLIYTNSGNETETYTLLQTLSRLAPDEREHLQQFVDERLVLSDGIVKLAEEHLGPNATKKLEPEEERRLEMAIAHRNALLAKIKTDAHRALLNFARKLIGREPCTEITAQLDSIFANAPDDPVELQPFVRKFVFELLGSPQFLLRKFEPNPQSAERLSDLDIARRLAAFLWSRNPDDALLRAVQASELQDPVKLQAQVTRMLNHPHIEALVNECFGIWFGFRNFRNFATVDSERFKEFTPEIRLAMEQEALHFCIDLLRNDLPVSDLILSGRTFLTQQLAKYYGIHDKRIQAHFTPIDVQKTQRGGLLGMGMLHASTSYALRTSAVLRGDWILKNVLGHHTPPPPAGVPLLPQDDAEGERTIREQLEKHRADKRCSACHDHIDPLGVPFEIFDPAGKLRERDGGGRAIDPRTEIAGRNIQNLEAFRLWLAEPQQKRDFLKLFCRKMLAYALGREIQIGDRALLEQMQEALENNKEKPSAAIAVLVNSRQFLTRSVTK